MIPTEVIDDILDKISIVEVISSYIPLKQAGRNLKALCPFHHEKTSSFVVSPDKQIYHCFGCGAGGNALSFIMQYEKTEFPEALEMLAKKAGIDLSHLKPSPNYPAANTKDKAYKVNEIAALYYQKNLLSAGAAQQAREYLNQRGISEKIAKEMRLGYAPDKWEALLAHFNEKSINPGLASQLGLVIANDKGGFYDRFRNRIIFPIFDIKSNIVAFGARVLDNSLPKYVNSPETPLYIKGRHLYGFNFSRDKVQELDSCIIVEGYMDFLIPYAYGISNIVASLGTALTREQIRLLKRYTHNMVIVYDGDSAGESAAMRCLDLFIEEGVNVKVASLDKGYDPDSFIRKFGPDAFRQKITDAQGVFSYKLSFLKLHYGIKTIEDKAKIIDEMLVTINKIDNAVIRADYLKKLSEELLVSETVIALQLEKIKRGTPFSRGTSDIKSRIKDSYTLTNKTIAFERLLVTLMLQEEGLAGKLKDLIVVSDFQDKALAEIVTAIFELSNTGKSISANKLLQHFSSPDASSLVCELTATYEDINHKEKAIEECVARLKKGAAFAQKHRLSEAIKHAQETNNQEGLLSLLREFNDLVKKKAG